MPKRSELKLTKRAVDALSVDAGDALFCDREQAGSGDDRHVKPAASLPAWGSNFQCASIPTRFSRRGPVKEARGIVGGVGDGDSNDDDGSVVSPACLLGTNMAGTNWE